MTNPGVIEVGSGYSPWTCGLTVHPRRGYDFGLLRRHRRGDH